MSQNSDIPIQPSPADERPRAAATSLAARHRSGGAISHAELNAVIFEHLGASGTPRSWTGEIDLDTDAASEIVTHKPLPGGRPKLADVYRQERSGLVRRLTRRTSIDQAEDIVHQVFARLLAQASLWSRVHAPKAYLGRAVANAWRDAVRRTRQQAEQHPVSLDDVDIAAPDPIASLESRDRLRRLEHALERLKPLTRQIFLARRLDGYSYAEIAARTGLSVKGVEKQMSRAIAQLTRHLRDL